MNGGLISPLSDISIRTGRTITWDPKRERIVRDKAAEAYPSNPRAPGRWDAEALRQAAARYAGEVAAAGKNPRVADGRRE